MTVPLPSQLFIESTPSVRLLGHSPEGHGLINLSGCDEPIVLRLYNMTGRLVWQSRGHMEGVTSVPLPIGVKCKYVLQVHAGDSVNTVLIPTR